MVFSCYYATAGYSCFLSNSCILAVKALSCSDACTIGKKEKLMQKAHEK
jgi:hypothetical protein